MVELSYTLFFSNFNKNPHQAPTCCLRALGHYLPINNADCNKSGHEAQIPLQSLPHFQPPDVVVNSLKPNNVLWHNKNWSLALIKLVTYLVQSHHMNQCWCIIKWISIKKCQWNLNPSTIIFMKENAIQMPFPNSCSFVSSLNVLIWTWTNGWTKFFLWNLIKCTLYFGLLGAVHKRA